jgi:hypothetical protein
MKKLLLTTLSILILFSCSGDDDNTPDNTPQNFAVKWKFKANGVLYQWEGTTENNSMPNSGASVYYSATLPDPDGIISLNTPDASVSVALTIPNDNIGTHILNDPFSEAATVTLGNQSYINTQQFGPCQINLNVSQIATAVGGITKGTFSGTLKGISTNSSNILTIQITEGSFESEKL